MRFSIIFLLLVSVSAKQEDFRIIEYQGKKFKTTYAVSEEFLGEYRGRKAGFLQLNPDGTGQYKYDVFGFAKDGCTSDPITFRWGFLLDDKSDIVKFKREYGYSFPLLLESTSKNSFQGCRENVLLDFIIDRGDKFEVSSSDDWEKPKR